MNGFLNIDPLSSPNDPDCIASNIDNLDHLVDHNSCELLLALDILDYFPLQMRNKVLNNYLCKICHAGVLILSGLDVREAGRAIYMQSIDLLREGNLLLYGSGENIWRIKKSLLTIDNTIEIILSTNQFQIIGKRFEGYNYIVEAKRN